MFLALRAANLLQVHEEGVEDTSVHVDHVRQDPQEVDVRARCLPDIRLDRDDRQHTLLRDLVEHRYYM